jgi:hypothetical protein
MPKKRIRIITDEQKRRYNERRIAKIAEGRCGSCAYRWPISGMRTCEQCSAIRRVRRRDVYKKDKERNRLRRIKIRNQVLLHYSHDTMKCVCLGCPETRREFLTIDHINNDGAAHRKEIGGGSRTEEWLYKNNFPEGFQILCHNCNWGKYRYGTCPHAA